MKRISEIWIYPIKSMGGISLETAQVRPKGFELDRRWMLVDEANRFITQREVTPMAFFKLSLSRDTLMVHHGNDRLEVPIAEQSGSTFDAVVWDDTVQVVEVSNQKSQWFSEKLGMKCKLVSFPEGNPRPVDERYKVANDHVGLADGYPYLIIGQSSLDDLNSRLATPVPMNRFRPNLVFTGGEPFEEDTWRNFSAGANRFVGVKPCARCVLTTVDQATGQKGSEPLATLSRYRRNENKVLFGQNVIALDYDKVSVGDEVVLE